MFNLLFAIALVTHAGTPPLRSRLLSHSLGRRCVAALSAAPRARVVERSIQRALRRQIMESPAGRALAPAHVRAMSEQPALRRYWRLLTLFPDVRWQALPTGQWLGLGAHVRLRVGIASPQASALWIDFTFADEPSSRSFYAKARGLLAHDPSPRENPDDLIKVFAFDRRTDSVLILISDFIADVARRDLATTDHLAERAHAFLKALVELR